MRRISLILTIVALIAACKNESSIGKPLPMDTMKAVMWELMNADEWSTMITVKDTTERHSKLNLQFYQQVFKRHNITKDQFYKSYEYYDAKPDKMKTLFDSLTTYGEKIKQNELQRKAKADSLLLKKQKPLVP